MPLVENHLKGSKGFVENHLKSFSFHGEKLVKVVTLFFLVYSWNQSFKVAYFRMFFAWSGISAFKKHHNIYTCLSQLPEKSLLPAYGCLLLALLGISNYFLFIQIYFIIQIRTTYK